MKKIGIVIAMNRESGLLELFPDYQKEYVCGIPFYIFDAGDNKVILTTCGVGEVASSSATALLIGHFGVSEIINYGFVGSLKCELPINMVMGVSEVVHTDMDLTAFGSAIGQYDEREEVTFKSSKELTCEILGNDVFFGVLASADKFVSKGEVKTAIANTFNADICDMEGAGIAVVCTRANIPFALIKVVVDGIEEDCTDSFSANSVFGVDGAIKCIATYLKSYGI